MELQSATIERQPVNPEFDQAETELQEARMEWAKLTARRQGRVRDWRIRGYNATKQRYDEASIEYAALAHADELQNATNDTERNSIAIQSMIDESRELTTLVNTIAEGGRGRKIVRKIGTVMAAGGTKWEIVKGAVVSATARAIGGKALSLATSGFIGYAKHESMRDTSRKEVSIDASEVNATANGDFRAVLEAAYAAGNAKYEEKTRELQSGVRRSVKHGVAVAATSFVLGNIIHGVATNFFSGEAAHAAPTGGNTYSVPGFAGETPSDPTAGHTRPIFQIPETSPTDNHSVPNFASVETSNSTTGHTTPGFAAETQTPAGDPTESHTTPKFSTETADPTSNHATPDAAASPETNTPTAVEPSMPEATSGGVGNVSAGEGMYSVFGEMGVDPSHHAELMQQVGPQLQEMSVAYEAATDATLPDSDMTGTIYGWNITGDLPPEANELILNTAQEHGWMTDTVEADPSNAVDVVSGGSVIESGEGMYSEFGQHAADGVTAQDVPVGLNAEVMAEAGPELVDKGVAYDAGIGEHGNEVYGWSHTGDVSDTTHKVIQEAAAQAQGEMSAETFSDSDWQAIESMLKEASADGNAAGFSAQNPALLNAIGPEIQGYLYPDGTPVASIGESGNWVLNESESTMPDGAYQAIHNTLNAIEGMHADDVAYMNVR